MITIVETPTFERQAAELLSEEERNQLFDQLSREPTIGDLIPGLGGVRKLRVGVERRGKRGGARVIYYYFDQSTPLTALFV